VSDIGWTYRYENIRSIGKLKKPSLRTNGERRPGRKNNTAAAACEAGRKHNVSVKSVDEP
jgi:hypothetical protein